MSLADLLTNAAAGRGLWAGLFARHDALPVGAHCTLAHFGRQVSPERVQRAVLACRGTAAQAPPNIQATSWAVARMDQSRGSVSALLIEGEEIYALHGALAQRARALGVMADRTFMFHPHITIGHHTHAEPVVLGKRDKIQISFSAITLVCGGGVLEFDLGASTEDEQMGLPF